ncbi:MAG: hypothetical protein QOI66_696 [Myxococcales bacterium]|nr:hypothetical protein [Myxococcales bacterium]
MTSSIDCLAGGGEMGALMRSFDWSKTKLGAVDGWPQSLRTAVSIMLDSGFGMVVAWGPEFIFLYNDRYRPVLGATKHPAALGRPSKEIFPEVWSFIGPLFEKTRGGQAVALDDVLIPLDRNGYLEDCFFTLSYSPIRDESGGVGGMLAVVAETTDRVQGERRMVTLRDLAAAAEARSAEDACAQAQAVLSANPIDVPFSLLYLLDRDGRRARLAGVTGLPPDASAAAPVISLEEDGLWQLRECHVRRSTLVLTDLPARLGPLPGGAYEEPAHTAVVLPMLRVGHEQPHGFFIAGVSPRRALDDRYRTFFELGRDHILAAIGNAVAYEEERKRAEALAEIDRAKTAFFSNVSHEFRTPLTLMLGPLDDALVSATSLGGEALDAVHRNALRLLKLVNTLLDFSRIEAGRAQASFAATDLSKLTAELASAFRSAIERAGLRFDVSCPPLSSPGFVDHDMWEKIVLNLVSNALKFTFDGTISVSLIEDADAFALRVSDTGTGIPESELPHLFERFHRVQGAKARTHEGSGIGLALVNELVLLHGGTINAESALGRGTTFLVRVPRGSSHLPADRLAASRSGVSTATGATAYVSEALRWLPAKDGAGQVIAAVETVAAPARDVTAGARILVVDDNADMRAYLHRLLSARWSVQCVADGRAALELARAERFDIVLSDVMMPNLDGFGLLRELRADPRTSDIPFVMLSARAGEEARVEGLRAGVDDYLVKPFSARELIARVESQLTRVKIRDIEERHARRLTGIFQHAPVGICVLRGPEHIFDFANVDYLKLISNRDVIGKPIRQALPELEGQGIYELMHKVYATGEPFNGHSIRLIINRGPGGAPEECFFEFVYEPLREDDGRIEGIIVVVFEVTALARARQEAEAAARAKDEFLAMLGHELRNPLSPIVTALQLMKLRGDVRSTREHEIIERQVEHLIRLVDDLLDIAKITRGKVQLDKRIVELAGIVARAVEIASPLFEHRGHSLTIDVPRQGMAVDADATRMAQVIANLLTNAAKYTEPGGHISVRAGRDGHEIVLRVKDDGIGLSPELLPRVFDLFVQGYRSADRGPGGLGIGLALVRNLVALHNGTVVAMSEGEGKGSEFVVRLPRSQSQSTVMEAAELPRALSAVKKADVSRRILVVDDNEDAADLLAEILVDAGHEVVVAHDGLQALSAVETFTPEVALLDIGLPVMDGYELAIMLRERLQPRPRMIAITGYGQDHDRERSQVAGFDAYCVKPLHPDKMLTLIEDVAPMPR